MIALVLATVVLATATVATVPPPVITAIDVVSPHRVPEESVRAAIGPLVGMPLGRGAVRESVTRVFALGLFSTVRVEEVPTESGVRLRYLLARAAHVSDVRVRGDLGVDVTRVITAAALPIGGSAEPFDLERARGAVRALYENEGFLGARIDVEATADPATNGRAVSFTIAAGARPRIARLSVAGATRLGEEFVRKVFPLEEDDTYRPARVRDGVEAIEKRYRDRDYPAVRVTAVTSNWTPETARVDLTLSVEEGPHVRIEFAGIRSLREKSLRQRLTFADSRAVDEAEVRASVRQLEAAYREEGHPFAVVTGGLGGDFEEFVVRFDVDEGPRVTVGSIEFTGDLPLPAARLHAQMETRPPGLLRRGLYRRDVLDRDLLALRAHLQTQGYPDASLGPPEITFSAEQTKARVVIPVAAGPRVTVARVSVEGGTVFPPGELEAALPFRRGDPWSQGALDEGRRRLERRYARRGYHGPEIAIGSTPRDGEADVTYRITEGGQTRIGQILIEGLSLTREYVVRRELQLDAGDPLDPEALADAERRLHNLGLFDRSDVGPQRPPPRPVADVTVVLQERKPWHFDLGVGYATFDGARAFVEIGHDNLFGTGRRLAVRERVSQRGDRTDLLYGESRVFGTRWRGDAGLFRERREEIGYTFERYGVTAGVEREILRDLIRGLTTAVQGEVSRIDRFDVDQTLVEGDVVPGKETVATLTPELRLDFRDRPFDPQRGSFHLLSFRMGGLYIGEADFVKTRLETSWFLDWLPPTILALSARLGLAEPVFGDRSLPAEQRFFAGGSTTVRGYEELRLGPLDAKGNPTGGNAQFILNAEWRFPLWRWLGGSLFFDSGEVFPEIRDLSLNELKSGIGGGLRVTTPVGPIRLDVGYPLDVVPGRDRQVRFYLTVGNPF